MEASRVNVEKSAISERAQTPQIAAGPGVGATEEYRLRISTAVLGRVRFRHPAGGEEMLVLERKCSAELKENGECKVTLNAQPPGGASVLKNPAALSLLTGGFIYDSEKSKREGDFRVQIRPADWPLVRDFCVENFSNPALGAIETDIGRELREEFEEALGLQVNEAGYVARNAGIEIQEEASLSERLGVAGSPTCRVFNIYDVEVKDAALIKAILQNSAQVTDESLMLQAAQKAERSPKGQGKVTALLAVPLAEVKEAFRQAGGKDGSVKLAGRKLTSTVGVTLQHSRPPAWRQ